MINKIIPSLDYNKGLDTQLNEPTNKNAIKVPKVVKSMKKKTWLYNFGVHCNKQPNAPSSLSEYKYLTLRANPNICLPNPLDKLCGNGLKIIINNKESA